MLIVYILGIGSVKHCSVVEPLIFFLPNYLTLGLKTLSYMYPKSRFSILFYYMDVFYPFRSYVESQAINYTC